MIYLQKEKDKHLKDVEGLVLASQLHNDGERVVHETEE